MQNLTFSCWGHSRSQREMICTDAHWLQKVFIENDAWVGRDALYAPPFCWSFDSHDRHSLPRLCCSVIVHNLYVVWAIVSPDKTNAPFVVDPDAVLSLTIAFKKFQPIPRWNAKVV